MKKLILFGDSNTYGYDPRGFLGGRYPEEIRWTTHVKKALGNNYEIIEEGMNGRMLPELGHGHFTTLLQGLTSDDVFVMMLGTNDILLTNHPNVAATLKRLDDILDYVNQHCLAKFILIAPPYISALEPELKLYHDCSVEMNEGYMKLANEHSINAINAGAWNIEMGYDGVHFSIEGHHQFAESLLQALAEIL
ncbi:GDSL-type esterase/lipase family protein [Pseudobutyrivibrio sp. MD2005]|uniref:GDSL-type esterase/lipase family protein n=1 Tax=Pseudobutyrivibrio sp. MD2005 TaxID=1410616 RepID=UPI00048897E6|nr:GDSL-type esterase/lipase family protein [Pseudobutyrivibrio sp. MD2005]